MTRLILLSIRQEFNFIISQKDLSQRVYRVYMSVIQQLKKEKASEMVHTRYVPQLTTILDVYSLQMKKDPQMYLSNDLSTTQYEQRGNFPTISIHNKMHSVRGYARNKRMFRGYVLYDF